MNISLSTIVAYIALLLCTSCSTPAIDEGRNIEQYIIKYRNTSADSTQMLLHDADHKEKKNLSLIYRILLAQRLGEEVDSIDTRSEQLLEEALAMTEEVSDPNLQAWCYTQIGYYYYIFYDYPRATSNFMRSSKLLDFKKAQSPPEIVDVYQKNGFFFGLIGDKEKGISYLEKALIHTPVKSHDATVLLFNLGAYHIELEQFTEARDFLQKAKYTAIEVQDPEYHSKALGGLALIEQKKKNYEQAERLWLEDLAISEQIGNDRNTMFANLHLSKLYLDRKMMDKAHQRIQQAQQYVLTKPYLAGTNYEISTLLRSYYSLTGDDVAELRVRRELDSIGQDEHYLKSDAIIAEIISQSQHEMLHWELETERLKTEKATLYQRAGLVLVTVLIVVIILIITLANRERKIRGDRHKNELLRFKLQKAESEAKLRESNSTLKSYKEYLDDKNKQIELLKARLQQIGKSSDGSSGQHRHGINELLHSHLMTDENWLQFKLAFMKEQPAYYDELITNFPDLTESNLRTILLHKLGLNNQQTGEILGITKEAVKKSKQRLRKKYGSSYEDILQDA